LIGGTGDPEKRTDTAKWDHVWKLIVKHEAQTGKGIDQKIANEHNKICAAKINAGQCERINAKKIGQIRYEYKRKQKNAQPS